MFYITQGIAERITKPEKMKVFIKSKRTLMNWTDDKLMKTSRNARDIGQYLSSNRSFQKELHSKTKTGGILTEFC